MKKIKFEYQGNIFKAILYDDGRIQQVSDYLDEFVLPIPDEMVKIIKEKFGRSEYEKPNVS